jgi:hypothetical protein
MGRGGSDALAEEGLMMEELGRAGGIRDDFGERRNESAQLQQCAIPSTNKFRIALNWEGKKRVGQMNRRKKRTIDRCCWGRTDSEEIE